MTFELWIACAVIALSLTLTPVGWPADAAAGDFADGDLIAGVGIPVPFSEIPALFRIRAGVMTEICRGGDGDDRWISPPKEIIVDSSGRVVFLVDMRPSTSTGAGHALVRCSALGQAPEVLARFESNGQVRGLHLISFKRVDIDDSAADGRPQVHTEDAYVFGRAEIDNLHNMPTGFGVYRYLSRTGVLEPHDVEVLDFQSLWDMTTAACTVNVDLTLLGLPTTIPVPTVCLYSTDGGQVQRVAEPVRIDLTARIGPVTGVLRAKLNLSAARIGGAVDDLNISNIDSGCVPPPGVPSDMPFENGAFHSLTGVESIVKSPTFGLTAMSNSIAAATPYLTRISERLFDRPGDPGEGFPNPFLGCQFVTAIKFQSILPFFTSSGAGNKVDGGTLTDSKSYGLIGSQASTGRIVRVVPGNAVEVLVEGLHDVQGVTAYPAVAPPDRRLEVSIAIRIDSPVSVLITDPYGRRLGVDPATGQPVNDFGAMAFDSGPGEPRLYALRGPVAGAYSVQAVGTGSGPFTIHVYSIDLSRPEGRHILVSGTAIPGGVTSHDFTLAADGAVAFAATANDKPVAVAGPDQTVNERALVTLDGSASHDSEAAALTFEWTQVGGPTVTLDLSDPVHPTFVAPSVGAGGTTLTFQLVVSDGALVGDPDSVDIIVRDVNRAPVADAGPDQAVAEGSLVTLSGMASFDPDADTLSVLWQQTGGPAVTLTAADTATPTFTAPQVGGAGATLVFTLTVSDGLAAGTDSTTVSVQNVNHPPVADAGRDQTTTEGRPVALDGRGSIDSDGDPLTYRWVQTAGAAVALSGAAGATPTFIAPPVGPGGETLRFHLTVDDGLGGIASDDVMVLVQNVNDPPACRTASAQPNVLWPPDHKLVPVAITGVSDPNGDPLTLTITAVTQDEPIDGLGDGDTRPDAVLHGAMALLRAERSAKGNGRVYQVRFRADDRQGGTCDGSVSVIVPRDSRTPVIDDGQLHVSTR
jgi:hypothetical protein